MRGTFWQAVRTIPLLLVLAISGSAVEKKEKQASNPAEQAKKAESSAQSGQAGDSSKKKFDTFVDKNRNGIDDRKERGSSAARRAGKSSLQPPTKSVPDSLKIDSSTSKKK